jgi:hypothetical protein
MAEIIQYQEPEGSPSSITGNGSLSSPCEKGLEIPKRTSRVAAGGPRTEGGKMRSSRNALKSGIFSRSTLLKGEPRSDYQSLLEGLWEARQPEGKLEELLVEKLASISWRYRRFLVAEGAEIRKKIEFPQLINQDPQLQIAMRIFSESDPQISRISDPDVFESCIEMLDELMQHIKEHGFDDENDRSVLDRIYGKISNPNVRRTLRDVWSDWFDAARVAEEERTREGYATPEEGKKEVLRAISAEIKRLRLDRLNRESIEAKLRMVEALRQSVPDSPGLDRLLRYESSLERSFDRTLTQLERQQRIRRGQPLPPQLDVKIS